MPGWRAEALAGTWWTGLPRFMQPTGLLLRAPSKVHTLLIHPLGLHSLDKAEEILVRHGGASGQHVRRWAALVINPGGLGRHTVEVDGLAFLGPLEGLSWHWVGNGLIENLRAEDTGLGEQGTPSGTCFSHLLPPWFWGGVRSPALAMSLEDISPELWLAN